MIDVEVFGVGHLRNGPETPVLEGLCEMTAASRGIHEGHVAIEFVDAEKIAGLNLAHRGKEGPTDVLSFPIDGFEAPAEFDPSAAGAGGEVPRELGDIVICPEYTADVREAVIHGMLHLLGMDHETDEGEMLLLQDDLLARAGGR
jgi:probable rRNA maturation factor